MDVTVIVALVGSGIAAIASIAAALVSTASAKQARVSAERVNSVNLRITALDRDSEELRTAYKQFLDATHKVRGRDDVLSLLAEVEILSACRASSVELSHAADAVATLLSKGWNADAPFDGLGQKIFVLRGAYQDCQAKIAHEREDFFTRDISDLDHWGIRMLNRLGR